MSVTKTVHSQTAPGPAEASSCCGHSWHRQAPRPKLTFLGPHLAGSWGVFLKFWQRTLPDTTSWALSPRGHPCVRACVRRVCAAGPVSRDGSECCWAGPTAPCTRPGPILLFKADFQSKSLKSPEWVQRAPLCAGDRAQVLRPRLAVLARSLFLARPQDSAGTWVSVSWLEKALSKRKVLYLGGGVPGT